MQLKVAHDQLAVQNEQLTWSVSRKTEELRTALEEMSDAKRRIYQAHLDTIRRLTIAAEYKDEMTAGHIARVGPCAEILAQAAKLSPGQIEMIRHAAPMHDVGNIGIPDQVLLKRGKLDDVERALMREHTRIGAALLAGSDSEVIQMGAEIALYHHEHWDGSGYPEERAGEDIPVEARICAIVDYFDSSTMDRPFRRALPEDQVLASMRELSALRFDPTLLEAFFSCLPAIAEVRRDHTAHI
jgi:putative two-component system response regulator